MGLSYRNKDGDSISIYSTFEITKTLRLLLFPTSTRSELGGCHVMRRRKADADFVIRTCSKKISLIIFPQVTRDVRPPAN